MTTGSECVVLKLGGCLEMDNLGEMSERFLAALTEGGLIVLDGSALERIDGAGMQLLLALARTAGQEGVGIEWRQPSRCLLEAAELMGLEKDLRLEADGR